MKKTDLVDAIKTARFENSKEKMHDAIAEIAARLQALESAQDGTKAASKAAK